MQTILPVAQAAWVLLAGGVIRADTHELVSQSHDAVPGSKSAVSMAYWHVPIACQATSGYVGRVCAASLLHHQHQIAVMRQRRVVSQQPQWLGDGLPHQQAVEPAAVMQWQARGCRDIHGANR